MKRYPDEIIIVKTDDQDPYLQENVIWEEVYRGRCRCFLLRQAGYRIGKTMDCTHEVVIPDRNMPDIGENYKVGVKMHTSPSDSEWTLVGYVKDFARYDRVCNVYFQMVKQNLIEEDIPGGEAEEDSSGG